MRHDDQVECAAHGRSPRHALRLGLQTSTFCLTALVDGRPEAMFGLVVTSALGGAGVPWMLGTDAIYDHPREMLAVGPAIIRAMTDSTPHLSNVVARRNTRAIRLLRRWGFRIGEEVILTAGTEFLPFTMDPS